MENILHHIDRCLAKLPVGTSVCESRNPKPMRRLLVHLRRGMELCALCLAFYENRANVPAECWQDWKKPDQPRSEPWNHCTPRHWQEYATRLLLLLCDHWDELSFTYVDYSALARNQKHTSFRPGDLLYSFRQTMLLCQFAVTPEAERKMLCEIHLPRAEWASVQRYALAQTQKPLMQLSVGEVLDSIQHYCSASVHMCYAHDLKDYFGLLELRLAMLIRYAGNITRHDRPEYRLEIANVPGVYMPHPRLLSMTSVIVVKQHQQRFSMALGLLPEGSIEQDMRELRAEWVERVRLWMLQRSKDVTSRSASRKLRDRLLRGSLEPGEVQLYKLKLPQEDDGLLLVLSMNRGDAAYASLQRQADTPPAEIITQMLKPLSTEQCLRGGESRALQLAMLELMEHLMPQYAEGSNWFDWCTIQDDLELQADEIKRRWLPRLVQVHNHWQLSYKRKLYWFNSFLWSLTAWLWLLFRDERGQLSMRTSLHRLAEEIFGPDVLPNQRTQVRVTIPVARSKFVA